MPIYPPVILRKVAYAYIPTVRASSIVNGYIRLNG